jgi:excisionase family DNA binding protein
MLTVENTNFYDLTEVERKLNVTKPTLLKWIKAGRLQAVKIGRPYFVSEH